MVWQYYRRCVLLALLVGFGSARDNSLARLCTDNSDDYQKEVIRDYLDELKMKFQDSEPVRTEDYTKKLVGLNNGEIYGLQDLALRKPAEVACLNNTVYVHLLIVYRHNIKMHFTWSFLSRHFHGGVWVIPRQLTFDVRLSLPVDQDRTEYFKLDRFRLAEMDGLRTQYDGIQPFGFLGSQIGGLITHARREGTKEWIERNFRKSYEAVSRHIKV